MTVTDTRADSVTGGTKIDTGNRNGPDLVCKWCGELVATTELLVGGMHDACNHEHHRAAAKRWPMYYKPKRSDLPRVDCAWCGRPMLGSRYRGHCSYECEHETEKAARRVVHEPIACEQCGAAFVPARVPAAYCSNACRQRAYRRRGADGQP